ncbi:CRISPR-associated endonuclease Cas2 [Candidatus Viridilinea mediisalina]|uniref:CRISPR-associated endoribonuclease Cas2 n=1 Tax=Candidatus Viridilinea mediisalina TaxID=2024553 RepID=A0A2A6RHQ4_9CHLR|nr:CRISPR-associated endonuclease Cas2 [Candidatus Viridilinea mediisalina]PDW02426.1 CRISPR-associated endonuclease Cas2 [Candidatus Viridilinea mediisalina]
MLYLISYDISSNRRRAKVSKLLEGFGQRVLESVFECDLDAKAYASLRKKMARRIQPNEGDRLRIYRLCTACISQIEVIGEGPAVEQSLDVYII